MSNASRTSWRRCVRELAHARTGRGARGNREVPPCAVPRVPRGTAETRGACVRLIFEKSQAGRRGGEPPRYDGLPKVHVPDELRRSAPPRLPELSEPEILRHFTQLSTRNFGIDTGFYPLGSCTMKYNPRINERVVGLPGFARLHPLAEDDAAQGALELEWELQRILLEGTGL